MKITKAIARGIFYAAIVIVVMSTISCNLSIGPDGKPIVGLDPVALAQTIQLWQARNGGSKGASVVIVDQSGKAITAAAVSPSGAVTSTLIPPAMVKPNDGKIDPMVVAESIQAAQKESGATKNANVIVVDSTGRGMSAITVTPRGKVTTEEFAPPSTPLHPHLP